MASLRHASQTQRARQAPSASSCPGVHYLLRSLRENILGLIHSKGNQYSAEYLFVSPGNIALFFIRTRILFKTPGESSMPTHSDFLGLPPESISQPFHLISQKFFQLPWQIGGGVFGLPPRVPKLKSSLI